MTPTRYIDHQGREVGVGYNGRAKSYAAYAGLGRMIPVRVTDLVPTRAQAQADLDAYAEERGWEAVE